MHKTISLIFWIVAVLPVILFDLPGCIAPANTPGATDRAWAQETNSAPLPAHTPAPLSEPTKSLWKQISKRWVVDREAIKLYAKWIIGAPVLVLVILILMLLRPRKKMAKLNARPTATKPAKYSRFSGKRTQPPPSDTKPVKSSDTRQVLHFFIRLFKHQQHLEPDADARLHLIQRRNYCPHDTYEMRVQHRKDWLTRRMSIGLLGQGGGSRSRCFYVIYDSHLVIKIPTEPMTDFSAYNRQIATEGLIVARLAPRLCIVPRVSVILKAIHTFTGDNLPGDVLEKKYIRLLESKPAYQEYLKIGGSFAFFMDLAKHFFLSTTLEEIHSGRERLKEEVLAYPDLLWDHNGFVGRYGEEAGAVCHELQDAFLQCENQLRPLIASADGIVAVPAYIYQQWFLLHLVGENINDDQHQLPADIIDEADQIIDNVLQQHRDQVQIYANGLRTYIRGVRFSQHRRQLENLASNTLDLLHWIMAKGLALRDLKPENLFVAGDPSDYPIFLNDPAKFSIGLIDVETAVVLDEDDTNQIPQPQLAGTPLFATPTHLLSNTILNEIYGDVRATLQMQDWHATVAILFKIITGEHLFLSTAHVFPEIVSEVKIIDPIGPDLERHVVKISRLFWNSASAEFQEAIRGHKTTLAQVTVKVPESLAPTVRSILSRDLELMDKGLSDIIEEQTFFTSQEKIRFLRTASAKKISNMKNRLVQERDSGGRIGQNRSAALIFFKHLERMKKDIKRTRNTLSALDAPHATIPADQLLEAMFQTVFQHMYLSYWPALAPSKYQGISWMQTDITTYQATL